MPTLPPYTRFRDQRHNRVCQRIQVDRLPHGAWKHQSIRGIAGQRSVQIQPLRELSDDWNWRLTLSSFRLERVPPPERLRDQYLLPVVILPEQTSQFAFSYAGESRDGYDRRGRLRQHVQHLGDLLE
jgi:hypothetical protein